MNDDDDDLVILDEHGAWTPVPSQTVHEPTATATPPRRPVPSRAAALSNLVTPSRREWTLPPLAPGQTYADTYDTVLIIDSSEQKMNESHIGYFRAHGVETVRMRLGAGISRGWRVRRCRRASRARTCSIISSNGKR